MATESISGLTYQEAGSLQTDALQNAELDYFSAWVQPAVISVGSNTPPASPGAGDRYIVGAAPTGAWASQANKLAVFRTAWAFYTPRTGARVTITGGATHEYSGTSWSALAAGAGHVGITFKDEGVALGTIATVDDVDFVGAGVTATRAANKVTVTIAGGGVTDGDKGDITVSAGGATWTIDPATITLAKQADVATGTVFYRKTAAAGPPEVQTLATLKTDLGLTGTNSGDQTITLTGDVTGAGTGSFAAAIAAGAVTTAKMGGDVTAAGKALLDDADAAAQRATLGLGTAATTAATAYATAAQGATADTALQPIVVGTPASAAGTLTLDFASKSRAVFAVTLTENVTTLTLSNLPTGVYLEYEIHYKQNATGGFTVAQPASHKATGGSDNAVATAANAVTVLSAASVDGGATWRYAMQESA